MFGNHPYFWLLASLPALPAPAHVERLPINGERLARRLTALPAADARVVQALRAWLELLSRGTAYDDDTVRKSAAALRAHSVPTLNALVETRLDALEALARLRREVANDASVVIAGDRRQSGVGRGPRQRPVPTRRWPWIIEARTALQDRANLPGLLRLLDASAWRELDRIGADQRFNLPALLVYLCRWELLERVLARDAAAATCRFNDLVTTLSAPHVTRFG